MIIRLSFPMFGVCATVKRTTSLDAPSNVTNQLQSFDDTPSNVANQLQSLDNTPSNVANQLQSFDKENFSLSQVLLWLDDQYRHDNTTPGHSVQVLHESSTSCHSNTMVTRIGGIKKSVQLFNSPYMGVDDKQGDSPAIVWSNKRRKLSTSHNVTMATNIGATATRNKPLRTNSCYGNKVNDHWHVTTSIPGYHSYTSLYHQWKNVSTIPVLRGIM